MPDPPSTSLLARYVLENPYPLGLVILVAAAALLWLGFSDGRRDRLRFGAAALLAGAAVIATGHLVVTPGERGETVVRALVEAVVAEDVGRASGLLASDATLSLVRAENVRLPLAELLDRIERFGERYTVESNTITRLRGYGTASDRAVVHLACLTNAGWGPAPSQWVLHVRRDPDGAWVVEQVVCVTIAGDPPRGAFW